jgi:hypothetical protein
MPALFANTAVMTFAKALLLLTLAASLLAGLGRLGSWKPRLTRR